MNTAPFRALVVDDEPQARQGLQHLLHSVPGFTCMGEAPNGLEAIQKVQALQPDLLLLDIQMPEINGFEVLHSLPPNARPLTIFITAYDSYAIQAFEVHAIDYILKPFTDARFYASMERARQQLEAQAF
ncbi:MAG: response regulator, partial [Bacteroidota bacterium]